MALARLDWALSLQNKLRRRQLDGYHGSSLWPDSHQCSRYQKSRRLCRAVGFSET